MPIAKLNGKTRALGACLLLALAGAALYLLAGRSPVDQNASSRQALLRTDQRADFPRPVNGQPTQGEVAEQPLPQQGGSPRLVELPSEFDLGRFPRGLSAHVDEALSNRRGVQALELARIVRRCGTVDERMDREQASMAADRDLVANQYRLASYSAMQHFQSQCQTLNGQGDRLRESLLRVAFAEGAESSAAELFGSIGVTEHDVVQSLVRDAANGDLSSIATLTSVLRPESAVPAKEIDKARYVLLQAAAHPTLGSIARPYLDLARRVGFGEWPLMRDFPEPLERRYQASVVGKTDVVSLAAANLDDAAKGEATATLQKLITRETRPKQ
ncbi:hypothetical protein [Pelomonas sp. SE-A7]|uniref:hypothetical protein n=1 Tax=Pelomonas sp. SE-A7 TaxID=3054953 RepID=UPI00259C93A4|nr:hypothetical protein [Pelomonas sp. SE-A7]MDM4767126.1 hypothetical protein [Pelomonas sp. SE-A7]